MVSSMTLGSGLTVFLDIFVRTPSVIDTTRCIPFMGTLIPKHSIRSYASSFTSALLRVDSCQKRPHEQTRIEFTSRRRSAERSVNSACPVGLRMFICKKLCSHLPLICSYWAIACPLKWCSGISSHTCGPLEVLIIVCYWIQIILGCTAHQSPGYSALPGLTMTTTQFFLQQASILDLSVATLWNS